MVERRRRSPSVPFIGLPPAEVHARNLYDRVERAWVSVADAAAVWGISPKSSGCLQTVAALLGYGLVEATGRGEARRVRISDLAAGFLADPGLSPEAEQRALNEMALKPKLIADYAARWLNGRPPDALCVEGLKIAHGFTKNAAERFLRVFDDTISLVRGRGTAVRAEANLSSFAAPPAVSVKIGDYVQWSAEGVDQYAQPRKVVWLLDGGRYLCVEGSQTRLSAAEVRVVAPPSGFSSHPSQVLLANGDWAGQNGRSQKSCSVAIGWRSRQISISKASGSSSRCCAITARSCCSRCRRLRTRLSWHLRRAKARARPRPPPALSKSKIAARPFRFAI